MTRDLVVHVIPELNRGGAERVLLAILDETREAGVASAVLSSGGIWCEAVREHGGEVRLVPLGRRSVTATLYSGLPIARFLRTNPPTIVHGHNVRATVAAAVGLRLSRRRGVPVVSSVQGLAPVDLRAAGRTLPRVADAVVACAPAVSDGLVAAGIPPSIISTIPNAAVAQPTDPATVAAFRRRHGLGDAPIIAGVGRLVEQKDWPTLIRAMAGIQSPSFQVVVAGAGPLRNTLEAEAMRLGVQMRFIGGIDDVDTLLTTAMGFVSTSLWEGLPLAHIEAASLGMPIVASAVDGVSNVFCDGESAVLLPPAAPAEFGAALVSIVNDSELRRRLGAGACRVAEAYRPRPMAQSYLRLYESLSSDLRRNRRVGLKTEPT